MTRTSSQIPVAIAMTEYHFRALATRCWRAGWILAPAGWGEAGCVISYSPSTVGVDYPESSVRALALVGLALPAFVRGGERRRSGVPPAAILEDLRGLGALLCGGGQEVLRDLRELVFRVFFDGGLVVAEQALPLVLDVLAIGDDKEDAEDRPLERIAQVLEGAAGGLPAFVLPPR